MPAALHLREGSFIFLSEIFPPLTYFLVFESIIIMRLSSPEVMIISLLTLNPHVSPSKWDCMSTQGSFASISAAFLISRIVPFLRPQRRFPSLRSTLFVQFNGMCYRAAIAPISMILSNLKFPPARMEMIATFCSFEPEINLDPEVAIATTWRACAFTVLAT